MILVGPPRAIVSFQLPYWTKRVRLWRLSEMQSQKNPFSGYWSCIEANLREFQTIGILARNNLYSSKYIWRILVNLLSINATCCYIIEKSIPLSISLCKFNPRFFLGVQTGIQLFYVGVGLLAPLGNQFGSGGFGNLSGHHWKGNPRRRHIRYLYPLPAF